MTHRFNGNLRNGSFGDQARGLFGIDNGAQIGFEYRFAPLRHLELVAYRTNFDRTIQLYAKWDAIHQNSETPLSVSGLLSIEGGDNFTERYAPSVGATISRQIDDRRRALRRADVGAQRHAAARPDHGRQGQHVLHRAGRARAHPADRLRLGRGLAARRGPSPNSTEYAFAIEKRAGAHLFQLNFGNSQGTTFAQTAAGGLPDSLFMGFNLTRKFF